MPLIVCIPHGGRQRPPEVLNRENSSKTITKNDLYSTRVVITNANYFIKQHNKIISLEQNCKYLQAKLDGKNLATHNNLMKSESIPCTGGIKKNPYPILKKELTYFYKVEHVNIDVISILVYKFSLKKNIDAINKNIPKINFFTQSIKDIINFLKNDLYNKYATKYIEVPQRREDFIQFMKINVEEAGGIVKYFRKWQSDLKQYDKAFEFFKNRSSIEEISKIANNTESAFNKDAIILTRRFLMPPPGNL
ncbi:15140_t:CDS:2 [Gigaspora rosea]|nr:15140_t:CDS:2 [Gigaspora rosea]